MIYNRPLAKPFTHVDLNMVNSIRRVIGRPPLTEIPQDGLDTVGGIGGVGATAFIAEGELFRIVPWAPSLQRKKGRPVQQRKEHHKAERCKQNDFACKVLSGFIDPKTKSSDRTLDGRLLRSSETAKEANRIKSTGGSVRVRWFVPGIDPADQDVILEYGFGVIDISFGHGTETICCGMQAIERSENSIVVYVLPFAWVSEDDASAEFLPENR